MNPIAKWVADPKHATLIKRIRVYGSLLFRIFLALFAWWIFLIATYIPFFKMPPRKGWIIPLVSALVFCLCYSLGRKFYKGFRTAPRFRALGSAALWIALAWVVFAGFRFTFLVAYIQIFNIPDQPPGDMERYVLQPYGWASAMLLICIFAPVVEELTFRGLIQRTLERRFAPVWAILIAAALFALVHFDGEMFVPHFFGGLVYGYVVFVTRSVWAGVIMHAGHNTLINALGHWIGSSRELSMNVNVFATTALSLILLVILIGLCYKLWKVRPPIRRLGAKGNTQKS